MIQAAIIGALAQSALVLSGLAVYVVRVPKRVVGGLAGYGAGADYVTDTNLVGTMNCLELAARDASDVIFLSTSRVYPIEAINNACEEGEDRFHIR